MQNLRFRKATKVDSQTILDIHNQNVRGRLNPNQQGFLLAEVTEEELLQKWESGVQYFVAMDDNDEVVGFLAVSVPKVDNSFLERVFWCDRSYKSKIARDGNIYIQIVAVKSDCMGQGIAQFLYESLYQQFPGSFFTAFVVSNPVENSRSLTFHEKQGFQPVGVVRHDQFLDLKNYESILMLKE